MSEFETLLERLLLDPAFKASLAADPGRALVGYTLTDEERGLLMTELSADAGRSARMEERTSKAALFGLLGAAAEMFSMPGGGLADVDSGASAPSGEGEPWAGVIKMNPGDLAPEHGWKNGGIQAAPFSTSAEDELAFYKGLTSEFGMPESDAGSKDAAYLTLGGDDSAHGGTVVEPRPGDFKLAPDPSEIKPVPPGGDIKPPPEGIKLAPGDITLAPDEIKPAPSPGTVDPTGIKMVPDDGYKAQSAFDPPAPIEPERPHK